MLPLLLAAQDKSAPSRRVVCGGDVLVLMRAVVLQIHFVGGKVSGVVMKSIGKHIPVDANSDLFPPMSQYFLNPPAASAADFLTNSLTLTHSLMQLLTPACVHHVFVHQGQSLERHTPLRQSDTRARYIY